jgi:hypothetical protein
MGSAFCIYGAFLALRYFDLTRESLPLPDDAYDSLAILVWGIINTFTEHRWGQEPWSHGDIQHTSMGVLWWMGGMLATLVSFRLRGSVPNVFPSLILGITGIAMGLHAQHRPISTAMHAFFGGSLVLASLARMLSIHWSPGVRGDKGSLGILTCFLLVQSGLLFMGSNEEALAFLEDVVGADAPSYGLLLSAAAFLVTCWIVFLIYVYVRYGDRQGDFADGSPAVSGYTNLVASGSESNVLAGISEEEDGMAMETTLLRSKDPESNGIARREDDSFDLGVGISGTSVVGRSL